MRTLILITLLSASTAQAQVALRYVNINGSDSADGLSPQTPKQSVLAAYDSLWPSGGQITVLTRAKWCNPAVTTCPTYAGAAFTGNATPGYSKCSQKTGICPDGARIARSLLIEGEGCNEHTSNASEPACSILSDLPLHGNKSWLYLDSVVAMTFRNLLAYYPPTVVYINESSSLEFDNIQGGPGNGQLGEGPGGFSIGTNCFFITLNNVDLSGNPMEQFGVTSLSRTSNVLTVQTASPTSFKVGDHASLYGSSDFNDTLDVASVISSTVFTANQFGIDESVDSPANTWVYSDRYFPIVINPAAGNVQGSGLININAPMFNNGGVKFYPGYNGGNLYVRDVRAEGDYYHQVAPTIWFSTRGAPFLSGGVIDTADLADPGQVNVPVVRIDRSAKGYSQGAIATVGNLWVDGPQYQTYNTSRSFSPTTVIYPNLASYSSANWQGIHGQPSLGPDGTQSAYTIAPGGAGAYLNFVGIDNMPVNVGDRHVGCLWAKGPTPYISIRVNNDGYGVGDFYEDGQGGHDVSAQGKADSWIRLCISGKVTKVGSNSGFAFTMYFPSLSPISIAFPQVIIIPAADGLTDADAQSIIAAMGTYSNACKVGQICGIH